MNFVFQASTEEEVLELVPHITLNPSFNIDMLEYIEAEVSPTGKKQGFLRGTRKFSFYGRKENFKNRTTLKKILKNSKIHNF